MRLSPQILARTISAFLFLGLGQTSAGQEITNPTNQTTPGVPASPTDIIIFAQGSDPDTLGRLLKPLTTIAQLSGAQANTQIIGTLVSIDTNNSNTANVNHSIALLSCDTSAYPGFYDVATTFQTLFFRGPYAIILYSNSSTDSGCSLNVTANSAYSAGLIYTTTSPQEMNMLQEQAQSNAGISFVISSRSTADSSNSTQPNSSSSSPLGSTSPSTAVAMIILYSITGVITALFLVIIVTGAIRAHRHPERYGPRAGLGRRPGQSRARGLARAMLDTLPIVKFGEKDEDKDGEGTTGDVEMGGVLAAGASGAAVGVDHDKTGTDEEDDSEAGSAGHSDNAAETSANAEDGDVIAPDNSKNALDQSNSRTSDVYAAPEQPAREDENLGCSICTEDFERGQDVRVLPCHHQFHPACIDPWLLNVSGTCPLCRVDLRPADTNQSRNSSVSSGADDLPPPIEAPPEPLMANQRRASRRSSRMWDIREVLNPRAMRDASAQERIAALRRVRERGDEEDVRRRRRLTARLHDVFSVKTLRRGRSPGQEETENRASMASASGLSRGVRGSVIEAPEEIHELPGTAPATALAGHAELPAEASSQVPAGIPAVMSDPVLEESETKHTASEQKETTKTDNAQSSEAGSSRSEEPKSST